MYGEHLTRQIPRYTDIMFPTNTFWSTYKYIIVDLVEYGRSLLRRFHRRHFFVAFAFFDFPVVLVGAFVGAFVAKEVQDLVRFVGKPNIFPFIPTIASSCGENKSEGLGPLLVWHLTFPFSSSNGAKD
jgi:hypothetical protein